MADKVVRIILTGNSAGAIAAMEEAGLAAKTQESKFQKLAGVGKAAFLGLGIAAGIVAVASVKQALEGQKAHALLVNAVEQSGHKFGEFGGQIDKVSEKFAHLGYENDAVESSLAIMTRATKDPQKALDNLGLAADVARGRHLDLESASSLVAKAMGGNSRALKAMGIDLKKLGIDANDPVAVLGVLNERFGGAAQAYAGTYAGRLEAVQAQAKNLAERIGNFLLPILAGLVDALSTGAHWLGEHKTVAYALAIAVGGVLTSAFIAWGVSLFTAGGALAFLMTPIAAVVIAVGALVAGAIALGIYWDQVWNFVANNPYMLLVLLPLGAILLPIIALVGAIKLLWDNWDAIWGWISQATADAWAFITGIVNGGVAAINGIVGVLYGVAGALGGVWDSVISAFSNSWAWIVGVVKGGINEVIGAWNGFARFWNGISLDLPSVDLGPLGEVGGGSFTLPSLPTIPKLHDGGIFQAPFGMGEGLALLRDGEQVLTPEQQRGGGDLYVTLQFNQPVVGVDQMQDVVVGALAAASSRGRLTGLKLRGVTVE